MALRIVPLHNSPRMRKRKEERFSPWVSALGEMGGGQVPVTPLNPANISGLRVLVDSSGFGALVDNDPIALWDDDSGLNNDFTEVTAGLQPIFKTGIVNGFPVARFDGVDDRLTTPYSPKDETADSFTFAAVFRSTTMAARQIILWVGDTNSPGFPASGFPTSTFSITDDGVANLVGSVFFSPTTADPKSYKSLTDTASFHIGICTFSGFTTNPGNKTTQMFLDGIFAPAHTESYSMDYAQYSAFVNMGKPGTAANFFSGDIAEAAIIGRALTQSEITRLYMFWKAKFAL